METNVLLATTNLLTILVVKLNWEHGTSDRDGGDCGGGVGGGDSNCDRGNFRDANHDCGWAGDLATWKRELEFGVGAGAVEPGEPGKRN